jgi:hypothetical protein
MALAVAVAASVIAEDLHAGALAVDFAEAFAALFEGFVFVGVLALATCVLHGKYGREPTPRNGAAVCGQWPSIEEPARRSTAQG